MFDVYIVQNSSVLLVICKVIVVRTTLVCLMWNISLQILFN